MLQILCDDLDISESDTATESSQNADTTVPLNTIDTTQVIVSQTASKATQSRDAIKSVSTSGPSCRNRTIEATQIVVDTPSQDATVNAVDPDPTAREPLRITVSNDKRSAVPYRSHTKARLPTELLEKQIRPNYRTKPYDRIKQTVNRDVSQRQAQAAFALPPIAAPPRRPPSPQHVSANPALYNWSAEQLPEPPAGAAQNVFINYGNFYAGDKPLANPATYGRKAFSSFINNDQIPEHVKAHFARLNRQNKAQRKQQAQQRRNKNR